MMEARGDFTVFNEPGMSTHHQKVMTGSPLHAMFHDSIPTFTEVQEKLLTASQHNNVFVKEMHFAARDYLLDDMFIKSPDCHIVFIIRDPHAALVSNYRKLHQAVESTQKVWQTKQDFPDYSNYSSLYRMYEYIERNSVNKPYVLIAEELIADPRTTITNFCQSVSIPMTERCLEWNKLDEQFSPEQAWNDSKGRLGVYIWHDRAMDSTGFDRLPIYKRDESGNPTFEEIEDIELRAAHRWEYYNNLMYYKKFITIAQQQ
jgi:hypothetical protein